MDLRQTPEYVRYMESIGWMVERKDGVNYYIKKFPLIGSFIKIQRPQTIDYQYIDVLAQKYRAFQIVIEPDHNTIHSIAGVTTTDQQINQLLNHGYKLSRSPYLPSKTILVDLTKSEEHLLKNMHYKTRYNIKKAKSLKQKVIISKDIEKFAVFWQECTRKQRHVYFSQKKEIINLYKAFQNNSDIVLILQSNKLMAGILLIYANKISYYMYAAASDAGKKLFAPTLNTWEAIKLSKRKGFKIFDFEGIYDERFPLKSWKGFTRFKKSFGGNKIEYPGAFIRNRISFS